MVDLLYHMVDLFVKKKLICDMVDFWGHMVLKTCYMAEKNLPYYTKKDFCLPYDIITAEFGPQ